ncbi:MAG: dihydropteroate synthase [Deltaproteobacteria bacterium]|nr:dihydropteroate synthase [Deltaproteobacteria bacterium]
MGVINVTPDSFSDGGKFLDSGAAIAHGLRLVEEGADLLDIGGESTRPAGNVYGAGMTELTDDDELARVLPVIQGLAKQTRVPISIDTRKLPVARAALDAGATIVNDVTGLIHAPELAKLVAERGASLCLMHSRGGDFKTMQVAPTYEDLLGEIASFLAQASARAQEAGVASERIAVDPGIGFGKTVDHNVALLNGLGAFAALGHAVLLGASRKSFIGALTGSKVPSERLQGSIAAAVAGAMRGASIVRVHDVKPTVEALKLADAVLAAS